MSFMDKVKKAANPVMNAGAKAMLKVCFRNSQPRPRFLCLFWRATLFGSLSAVGGMAIRPQIYLGLLQ